MADEAAALRRVRNTALAYDRAQQEARDAFFEAVREAAKVCTQTEIAAACDRSVTRINQIVRDRPHSRRPVVESSTPTP